MTSHRTLALLLVAALTSLAVASCSSATPTASPTATLLPAATSTAAPTATAVRTLPPTATATRTLVPSPTVTPVPTIPPTPTRIPLPVPAAPRPTPKSGQNSQNGLFDVVVLVDKRSPDVPRADVTRVFEVAATQMAARTGQWMRLVDVVYGMSRATTGNEYVQMENLALDYLKQNPANPPEGIILFTDTESCRNAGGFSRSIRPGFAFQNEFKSPRPEVGADKVYLAVVEYNHPYAQCGYGTPGGQTRVSPTAINGECRNRTGVTCVPSGDRWTCPNTQNDLYADHDYFIASIIVHEFIHPFGIDPTDLEMDHYGATGCQKRGSFTADQYKALANGDLYEAQLNLGLCPDVFARFRR